MIIRPRVIAVETYGVYGPPTLVVKELLENMGYIVEECGFAEPRLSQQREAWDVCVLLGRRNQPAFAP
jgi:hypothetical protein